MPIKLLLSMFDNYRSVIGNEKLYLLKGYIFWQYAPIGRADRFGKKILQLTFNIQLFSINVVRSKPDENLKLTRQDRMVVWLFTGILQIGLQFVCI